MEFPKTRAEKIIRGLNLFPELDVNIAEEDPAFTESKIVEKGLKHYIYVDQPTGKGFSYTSDEADIRMDSQGAAVDFCVFMQAFFEAHPQHARNDFYIIGESYAGHYIPAFADRVQRGNNNKEGIHINMKGLAIGSGLTEPEIQYKAYADCALSMKLITQSDYNSLGRSSGPSSACTKAFYDCTGIFNSIVNIIGRTNYFDIRKKCAGKCYDFSKLENFLNQKSVRQALGVGDIQFVTCKRSVYDPMKPDWMKNYEVVIPALLENGVKLLVYAGEYDLVCNWHGNARWVDAMVWSGQKNFVSAPSVPFKVDGEEAGLMKSSGLLTFLKVYNAGHWIPADQPKVSLEMIKRWMQGIPPKNSCTNPIIVMIS
ncbi:serine carboxypeptidase-like 48 [Olea europaea subsp. europaea]|uniref:Carboxypeptidase n=1 Tax=Olea europaea subsp. europaea TaxID=158383 RepID=A0A8S0P801_OLEEU|nr:serine carboxypeptidase-like 48 [Olea europaea subsp. europaea]